MTVNKHDLMLDSFTCKSCSSVVRGSHSINHALNWGCPVCVDKEIPRKGCVCDYCLDHWYTIKATCKDCGNYAECYLPIGYTFMWICPKCNVECKPHNVEYKRGEKNA